MVNAAHVAVAAVGAGPAASTVTAAPRQIASCAGLAAAPAARATSNMPNKPIAQRPICRIHGDEGRGGVCKRFSAGAPGATQAAGGGHRAGAPGRACFATLSTGRASYISTSGPSWAEAAADQNLQNLQRTSRPCPGGRGAPVLCTPRQPLNPCVLHAYKTAALTCDVRPAMPRTHMQSTGHAPLIRAAARKAQPSPAPPHPPPGLASPGRRKVGEDDGSRKA